MKASELQQRLTELINKHGDRQVGVYNNLELEFDSVYEISPRVLEKTDRLGDLEGVFFGITTYEIGDSERQIKTGDH